MAPTIFLTIHGVERNTLEIATAKITERIWTGLEPLESYRLGAGLIRNS